VRACVHGWGRARVRACVRACIRIQVYLELLAFKIICVIIFIWHDFEVAGSNPIAGFYFYFFPATSKIKKLIQKNKQKIHGVACQAENHPFPKIDNSCEINSAMEFIFILNPRPRNHDK
jgi:hypothetical protein